MSSAIQHLGEFGGGKVREHLGGIYDWLRSSSESLQLTRKGEGTETVSLSSNNSRNADSLPSEGSAETSGETLSYAERKELQKKIRKAQRAVDD